MLDDFADSFVLTLEDVDEIGRMIDRLLGPGPEPSIFDIDFDYFLRCRPCSDLKETRSRLESEVNRLRGVIEAKQAQRERLEEEIRRLEAITGAQRELIQELEGKVLEEQGNNGDMGEVINNEEVDDDNNNDDGSKTWTFPPLIPLTSQDPGEGHGIKFEGFGANTVAICDCGMCFQYQGEWEGGGGHSHAEGEGGGGGHDDGFTRVCFSCHFLFAHRAGFENHFVTAHGLKFEADVEREEVEEGQSWSFCESRTDKLSFPREAVSVWSVTKTNVQSRGTLNLMDSSKLLQIKDQGPAT